MSDTGNQIAGQVKAATDIVIVVGEYVRLKRISATQSYTGLCPFHTEKTPSFRVHANDQFFKCFGCGLGGDVFKFVQEMERVSFGDALKILAERAGITSGKSSQAQNREWRREREERKNAELWSRTAIALAELLLDDIGIRDYSDVAALSRVIAVSRGTPMVEEYRAWRQARPQLTKAMVKAGKTAIARVQRRLATFVVDGSEIVRAN